MEVSSSNDGCVGVIGNTSEFKLARDLEQLREAEREGLKTEALDLFLEDKGAIIGAAWHLPLQVN